MMVVGGTAVVGTYNTAEVLRERQKATHHNTYLPDQVAVKVAPPVVEHVTGRQLLLLLHRRHRFRDRLLCYLLRRDSLLLLLLRLLLLLLPYRAHPDNGIHNSWSSPSSRVRIRRQALTRSRGHWLMSRR